MTTPDPHDATEQSSGLETLVEAVEIVLGAAKQLIKDTHGLPDFIPDKEDGPYAELLASYMTFGHVAQQAIKDALAAASERGRLSCCGRTPQMVAFQAAMDGDT